MAPSRPKPGVVKRSLLRGLSLPVLSRPLRRGLRDRATIFVLHRIADPERGIAGTEPAHLRRTLEYLRRERYELLSLADVFDRLAGHGSPPGGAVCFTIDDGYVEHATVAAPLFAHYECPVSTFVCTGFLDRALWLWWDQVEYLFRSTRRRELELAGPAGPVCYRWHDAEERVHAQEALLQRLKLGPDEDLRAAVRMLAEAAEVELPEQAPPEYAPMSWDELRAAEHLGMTFGPHTVTHPILSRTSDDEAARELGDSWGRVATEATRPVRVFCYPNGGWSDFGEREVGILRGLGLTGAVVTEPGYADAASFRDRDGPFKVRRFGVPDTLPQVAKYVSGIERLKEHLLRGGRR